MLWKMLLRLSDSKHTIRYSMLLTLSDSKKLLILPVLIQILAGQTVCKLQMIRLRRNNAPTPPTAAPLTGHLASEGDRVALAPSWSLLFSAGFGRTMHARTHARTHTHTHARTHARTHTHARAHTQTHRHTYTSIYTHTCMHTYIYIYIFIYVYIYLPIHTHTHVCVCVFSAGFDRTFSLQVSMHGSKCVCV